MVIGKAARCRFVLRRVWWLTEESHKVSCYVQEGVLIVERGESHGGRGWEEVVVVDRGESQGLVLCPGGRGDREHESQGLVLCPRGHGDSRQGRVTKCHVAFRKAW